MIDVHAHILPGIDDGPSTVEESVRMCRMAVEDGIATIIATPHMLKDIYPVSRQDIMGKVDSLNAVLRDEDIDLTVLPGAEVALSPDFVDRLFNGDLLTVNDSGGHVFIELTEYFPEQAIEGMLQTMVDSGIIPIISHPERNASFQKNLGLLERFIALGAMSQVTASSITGGWGKPVQRCVTKILKRDMTHFIATDAHSPKWRPPILSEAVQKTARIIGKKRAQKLVSGSGLNI